MIIVNKILYQCLRTHTHTHKSTGQTTGQITGQITCQQDNETDRRVSVACRWSKALTTDKQLKGRIGVCRDRMAPMVSAASRSIVELDRKYKRMQRPVELQAHAYAVIINFTAIM